MARKPYKNKGRALTKEHKASISRALKGRVFTDEHKANISKAQIGRVFTEEHKQKLRDNHVKTLTEEHKRKISESNKGISKNKGMIPWNKGKTGIYSEETLKRISEKLKGENNPNYGKTLTEEHKRKISESNKGKKRTPEVRKKLREAQQKRRKREEMEKCES